MSRSIDVVGAIGVAQLIASGELESVFSDARTALLEAIEQLDGVAQFLVGHGEEAELASRGIRKALAHIGHGVAPR